MKQDDCLYICSIVIFFLIALTLTFCSDKKRCEYVETQVLNNLITECK